MFKKNYSLAFVTCMMLIITAQAYGVTITNIDINRYSLYNVEISLPKKGTQTNIMGSCWGNNSSPVQIYDYIYFENSESYESPSESSIRNDEYDDNYVCIQTSSNLGPAQKFMTNPLKNTNDCEIQFFKVEGGKDNPGTARASKACGYVGRCVDGRAYNENARHIGGKDGQGTDSFKKNCLPYKPWE